ncbi:ATP-binding protein [Deinococcus antarcticus]|jgi:hypothetical protein|uniref:ATP-binding protein n=1 Tax=Deinococcus antarcticus TaxID=1298767 RepID=A0ABV8AA70_9DEIO
MSLREIEVTPNPAGTLQALAGGGYTTETAVADLIDNAISGGAATINIFLDVSGTGRLIIEDDGLGMATETLISAMKIAARHGQERASGDLGRFGTGMKAAALFLSTSGRFTVGSATLPENGTLAILDQNQMERSGRWVISLQDHVPMPRGSVITVDAPGLVTPLEEASIHLRSLSEHLRSTFATHLADRLVITLQGHPLLPWPLCSPDLPEISCLSSRVLDHGRVRVTAFILPTHQDEPVTEGPKGRREHAGFHVHRAGRALTLGGWQGFRLPGRQASIRDRVRVLIEIQPELDEEWQVNLSKSGCNIPVRLRPAVRRIVDEALIRAGRERNPTVKNRKNEGIWTKSRMIRRDHSLIRAVVASGGDEALIEQLLVCLEEER